VDKLHLENPGTTEIKATENIFIKSSGRYIKIKLEEIMYIENVGDYVKFQLKEKSYISHSTLKALAAKLPQDKFMKVHRSYIVNLNKIVDLEENSLLVGRKIIPVSRANKANLLDRLNLI
jgi:DNA-binding LytR/AlgR family response regulator